MSLSTRNPVDHPNVVLIITDDQRYGTVGVHGNDQINTPNIVKNNGLLHRVCPKSDRVVFSFTDTCDVAPSTRDWYYVRVFQADDNAAWSSPIWVGPKRVDKPSVSLCE